MFSIKSCKNEFPIAVKMDSLKYAAAIRSAPFLFEYSIKTNEEQRLDVALNEQQEAFKAFRYIIENFENTKNLESIFAKTYANLTGMYSYLKEYEKAEKAAEKAIDYYKALNDTLSIIGVKNNLAVTYYYRKDYDKAVKQYIEALPFLQDTTRLDILNLRSINLGNLSDIYYNQKKYKLSRDTYKKAQN